ncbi:MAG: metalloprotease [Promethearchaeota archaeon]
MSQKPNWEKEFTKKGILDRLHLSVQEISELGISWIIISFVILFLRGTLNTIIQEGKIPTELLIYLFVLGISFFAHELSHKFIAIKYGARAYYKLSKEAVFLMMVSLIVGFPILATGAVFWWGEATASPGIRGRVSASGPITNFILAGLFMFLQGVGLLFNITVIIMIGSAGVWLNVFLGVFNLLPIGVLDGAKVLAWDPKIWISLIGSLIALGFFGIFLF